MIVRHSATLPSIRKLLPLLLGMSCVGVPVFAAVLSQAAHVTQPATSTGNPENELRDITGSWQGTLDLPGNGSRPGRALRIVLKISKAADGSWTALNYSIDQGAQPMKTVGVALQGRTFKYSVPAIGGSYEGELSTDGNSIAGKWAQTLPLVFVRASKDTAWEIPEPPAPRKPMTDTDPSFLVATIKPSSPDEPGKYFRVVGRTYSTHGTSLADLIQVAYGVQPKQIIGAPAWVRNDKFDLVGIQEGEGEPNATQWLRMVQKVLAGRFELVFHHEQQELSTYVLSIGKGGPKNFTPSQSSNPLPSMEFRPVAGGLLLPAKNATMGQFAQMMQQVVLDRPMIDRTGMMGRFDFQLTFVPDETQFDGHPPSAPPQSDMGSAPSLFAAIQQQLGLKLSVEKVPTDVLVIDHVQKPSPN